MELASIRQSARDKLDGAIAIEDLDGIKAANEVLKQTEQEATKARLLVSERLRTNYRRDILLALNNLFDAKINVDEFEAEFMKIVDDLLEAKLGV
jgi:glycine cleavage system regulatory protein